MYEITITGPNGFRTVTLVDEDTLRTLRGATEVGLDGADDWSKEGTADSAVEALRSMRFPA